MAIIRAVPKEGAGRAVLATPSTAVTREVSKLGQQIAQVEQRVSNANRSRRVNEAATKTSRAIAEHEASLSTRPTEFEAHRPENDKFLTDFKKQLTTEAADAPEREAITANFDRAAISSQTRVRQKSQGLSIQAGKAALEDMVNVLSINYAETTSSADRRELVAGLDAAITQAEVDGVVSEPQGTKIRQGFSEQAERLRAERDIETDPTEALTAITAGDYALAAGDKQVVAGRAKRAIAAEQAALEKAAAQHQQRVWTDLHDAIDQGDAGRADIEKARAQKIPGTSKNQLSEQATRSLFSKLRRKEKSNAKKTDWRAIYESALSTGKPLDKGTKEHREAVENAFVERADGYANMIPDNANRAIVDEILRPTKIMPASLLKEMRIAAKDARGPALDQYSRLYSQMRRDSSVSPALASMSRADESFWSSVSNLRDAGVSNKESVALARHAAYEMTSEDKLAVRVRYKEKKYRDGNKVRFTDDVLNEFKTEIDTSSLEGLATSAWSRLVDGAPDAPPGMVADYQNLVKTYYMLMPEDIDEARQLAKEATLRAWTIEEFDD